MCGRFTLKSDPEEIEETFGAKVPVNYAPHYNIAPTQDVLVLLGDGSPRIEAFRWGLIPSWAKDEKIGNKLINARAETIFEKPSFRSAVKSRRCLVIADGFYEWRQTELGKRPMHIRLKSKEPFGFAGLWESWNSPEGKVIKTCTIVTTDPNELMKAIHNRMPVILSKELQEIWLDAKLKTQAELELVLQAYPAKEMEAYEVSRLVNSPTNDKPECVEPVGA
ncbi:SOS response-associated peptidase [Candidatus Acetothermia bacterium]|nr:SOS response-associated peptidase [Candidatus Acetothermia bacterium]